MASKREPERPIPMRPGEASRSQEPDLQDVTVTPGSAPDTAGSNENQSPITREIVENFLACKTKAYLKLHGKRGTKSDYEALSTETRAELRDRAAEMLVSRLKPEDVIRGVKITSIMAARPPCPSAMSLDSDCACGELPTTWSTTFWASRSSRSNERSTTDCWRC